MKTYVCIRSLMNDKQFFNNLSDCVSSVTFHPSESRPKRDELYAIVRDYDIVICGVFERFDEAVCHQVRRLKLIASLSVGLDHIEKKCFEEAGVKIINTPSSNVVSVAEHTWALILAVAKRIVDGNEAADVVGRKGMPTKPIELFRKKIGVLGAGPIAYYVSRIARCFEMDICLWTLHPELHPEFKSFQTIFERDIRILLGSSDVVSLHLPLTNVTRNIISKKLVSEIHRESPMILVNASRAGLIEKGALANGINRCVIGGVGLDVFNKDEIKMLPREKVVLSPHIAGLSIEAIKRMRSDLMAQIREYISTM